MPNSPKHIAIIMDGNGRWANQQGKKRSFGHQNGINPVRESLKGCMENDIKYLTLYAFSTENWSRPKEEVDFLMGLLVEAIENELAELMKNKIRLTTIGDITKLPETSYNKLIEAIDKTKDNKSFDLILAINYGGRTEIVDAIKAIAIKLLNNEISIEQIDEAMVSNNLYTNNIPDPDILIRTSLEYRLSNFLLWQSSYTEFFFLDKLWPDFNKEDIVKCISEFKVRNRRFGKILE